MNAVFEVLMIALGTAVLAALIVAADWDLGVIRAWQALIAFREGPQRDTAWRHTLREGPVKSLRSPGDYPDYSGPGPLQPVLASSVDAGRTRADEWLAAAAAHRLSDYVPMGSPGLDGVTGSVPARPLREVLADRRAA